LDENNMTQKMRNWLLLAPAGAWFLVMLVIPLSVVFIFSFGERAPSGGVVPAFTFEQYANLPARWAAFKNTMTLAPIGTFSALLIAYPLAYWFWSLYHSGHLFLSGAMLGYSCWGDAAYQPCWNG
jgi:ABC-type spermidine/putrescine transport system permease subunit I